MHVFLKLNQEILYNFRADLTAVKVSTLLQRLWLWKSKWNYLAVEF